jgi:hypothetical protein
MLLKQVTCHVRYVILRNIIRGVCGVGLNNSRGLKTWKPENPINFWFYEPQHEDDTALTH